MYIVADCAEFTRAWLAVSGKDRCWSAFIKSTHIRAKFWITLLRVFKGVGGISKGLSFEKLSAVGIYKFCLIQRFISIVVAPLLNAAYVHQALMQDARWREIPTHLKFWSMHFRQMFFGYYCFRVAVSSHLWPDTGTDDDAICCEYVPTTITVQIQ